MDAAGGAYITGFTDSTIFYTTNAVQTNLLGVMNAFVAKTTRTAARLPTRPISGAAVWIKARASPWMGWAARWSPA